MTTKSTRKLHICIDCGGSKTSAALASTETGEIITYAIGGPSNFTYLGPKEFAAVIRDTLNRGLRDPDVLRYLSGLTLPDSKSGDGGGEDSSKGLMTLPVSEDESPFHSAWIAVSGVDTPSDIASASSALSPVLGIPQGPHLTITNDTHLLAAPLAAQSTYPSCITVVAGTGSCIVSFKREEGLGGIGVSELARTGGYGWILGDEGGGFHVGRETIRELCLREDLLAITGCPPSESITLDPQPTYDLQSMILDYFGLSHTARCSDIFAELYAPDPNPNAPIAKEKGVLIAAEGKKKSHLLLERQQRLSRLTPLVFKAAFPPELPGKGTGTGTEVEFVPDPIAVKILTYCVTAMAEMIILLCAPPSTSTPHTHKQPTPKYITAPTSLLCLGGSLVKQEPYRNLLRTVLDSKGYTFAEMVYVDHVEKRGVDALVLRARAERDLDANANGIGIGDGDGI